MKKRIAVLLISLLALGLCACGGGASGSASANGGSTDGSAGDTELKLESMGDAFEAASDADNSMMGFTETYYCFVFEKDGKATQVYTLLTPDQYEELDAIEFDENWSENTHDVVAPLPIAEVTDLTAGIPTQEELDQWIGKTGQELIDAGWTQWGYYLENSTDYFMEYGAYAFTVTFNETLEGYEEDDFDGYEAMMPLTVKSIEYTGIGNGATDIVLPEE